MQISIISEGTGKSGLLRCIRPVHDRDCTVCRCSASRTSYAEKEGTFSNTERRVQRVRKVQLEGEMRLDTDIFIDLMNRMGYPQPHLTSEEIMDEIASVTPIFGGISHRRLDKGESIQWPCPDKNHPGTPILHVGKFSRGLGWFYPAEYVPSAELPDEEYPFIMMTGRILYHYNTRAMTGKTPRTDGERGTFLYRDQYRRCCKAWY